MGKVKLTREQSLRAGHLLHMRYTVAELAEEIGCTTDTVYKTLLPAGCPHERDAAGHIWIIGTEFAQWARARKSRGGMGDGATGRSKYPEGYALCMRCKQVVPFTTTEVRPTNPFAELVRGTCDQCGATVHTARKRSDAGRGLRALPQDQAWCDACRKRVYPLGTRCPDCGGKVRTEVKRRERSTAEAVR